MVLLKNDGVLPIAAKGKKIAVIGPHAGYARKMFGGYTHMCMMESTYAIANSIAGVSGVVQADADEIITVPGTNIQSDETEQFDQILKRQKPQCRNLYEEFQIRFPESEILYAYGYPIAGNDESHFEEALQAAKQADIVILTLGGKHGTCSMASMEKELTVLILTFQNVRMHLFARLRSLENHWLAFTLMEDRFPVMLQRNI